MAGARGVARDSKPVKRPKVRRDLVAEQKLSEVERALEEAVAAAIAAKDTSELLRLHGHFLTRVREAVRHDPASDESAGTPAADAAVDAF